MRWLSKSHLSLSIFTSILLLLTSVSFSQRGIESSNVTISIHHSEGSRFIIPKIFSEKKIKRRVKNKLLSFEKEEQLGFSTLAALNQRISESLRLLNAYGYISPQKKLHIKIKAPTYLYLLKMEGDTYKAITGNLSKITLNRKEYELLKQKLPYFSIKEKKHNGHISTDYTAKVIEICKKISHFQGVELLEKNLMAVSLKHIKFILKTPKVPKRLPISLIKKLAKNKKLEHNTVDLRYDKIRVIKS